MKVVCVRIVSATTGQVAERDAWLTVGKEYLVLAVAAAAGRTIELRMVGDQAATPALFAADQFEMSDTRIPSNWRASIGNGTNLDLAPESWLRPGFWEEYFDGQSAAIETFEVERSVIMSETG